MKENTSYKIVALLITFILWIIIIGSKDSVTVKLVSVDFILPKGLAITNNIPREIAFRAAGPRLVLKKFLESKDPVIIDLGSAQEGVTTVRLHADSVNLPPGVRILSMSPSTISPKLERVKP